MTQRLERLALRLENEKDKTIAFFQSIPPVSWEGSLYQEGAQWSILELLKHFVQSEIGIGRLVEDILAGGSGVPEDFDLDRYNEAQVGKNLQSSANELLEAFARHRAANVKTLRSMQEADLDLVGRHPFLGMARLEDILKLLYRHNQIHQRDIRRHLKGIRRE